MTLLSLRSVRDWKHGTTGTVAFILGLRTDKLIRIYFSAFSEGSH